MAKGIKVTQSINKQSARSVQPAKVQRNAGRATGSANRAPNGKTSTDK
ncbi:hypothetical protein [Halobacillus sp. B29]